MGNRILVRSDRFEVDWVEPGPGVRVTVVQPGVVDTPFYAPGGDSDNAALARTDGMLQAEDVARTVMWTLEQPDQVVVRSVTDEL